ncbi:hypothetical protein Dimus_006547 [Dionaea muscipula]
MAYSSSLKDSRDLGRERNPSHSSTSSSSTELTSSRGEEVVEDTVYVAVGFGKEVMECKYTLIWALQNSKGKKICLIHVHEPPQTISILGGKFPISKVGPKEARPHLEKARRDMLEALDEYVDLCRQAGVRADKIYIEMDSIQKGIVELISQHKIGKLVMGAAADNRFSRKMIEPKSEKAIYVRKEAPAYCHIWFVCKGRLIYTREGVKKPSPDVGLSLSLRSLSLGENNQSNLELDQGQGSYQKSTDIDIIRNSDEGSGWSTPRSRLDADGGLDEYGLLLRSQSSSLTPCSKGVSSSSPFSRAGAAADGEPDLSFLPLPQTDGKCHIISPPSVLQDRSANDEMFDQLEQAMIEAENARRGAFEESRRRTKAEHKAKVAESSYSRELRRREEIQEELVKVKGELGSIKNQRDGMFEELQNTLGQKSFLEDQLKKSNLHVKELEEKIVAAVQLLQQYKEEREELQIKRDNALCEAEELRKQLELQPSSSNCPQYFSTFSPLEIEEATNHFDPSLKIGEGGYGNIYKGSLRHTEVAVKIPHLDSTQSSGEFYQEVEILSKLRHPNIITLIGVCEETWALVYEYLPHGSLEDRLTCKDNTPPLSWQERLRIAAELCSVLIFLHSSEPHSIIHGDLKPANVLLDGSLRCKLSDFGISRAVARDDDDTQTESMTKFYLTEKPRGTFAYMDPEFLASGELSTKSDVYSYGIILLRLLTGKSAKGITKEVQYALEKDNLHAVLDPLAGDWPFVQADQLARLALRCCDLNRSNRPDLVSEVWRTLEAMRASCGSLSSFSLGDDDDNLVPSYFICPVFQEIMQDPHLAADGFTYEAEALRGWLDAGHDTSPMTNLKLAHQNLTPNLALRSAIQEWLQRRHGM